MSGYTPDFKRRAVAKLANGCRLADVSKAPSALSARAT
jgi:hypothetical protein